jgi:hypothetical protein
MSEIEDEKREGESSDLVPETAQTDGAREG